MGEKEKNGKTGTLRAKNFLMEKISFQCLAWGLL